MDRPQIFITGASGFIGSELIRRLDITKYSKVYCLTRNPEKLKRLIEAGQTIIPVKGDICDAQAYAPYLKDCETVVHLAATTGKAKKADYFRVNTDGTSCLLDQCVQAGVQSILNISTIAVKYADKNQYYYAQSKEQAEDLVSKSGLCYINVRPTIVVGDGSPIWQSFSKLSNMPVLPIFGNGQNQIQPIYIGDLVDALIRLIETNSYANQVLELGGREKLTIESFLKKIHFIRFNRDPSIIHIPISPIRFLLRLIEDRFNSLLPLTSGQLLLFNNDGTVKESHLPETKILKVKNVEEMIIFEMAQDKKRTEQQTLVNECYLFSRHLIGIDPTDYVVEKYCEAHSTLKIFTGSNNERFDEFLLQFARKNAFFLQLASAYTAIFRKSTLLRYKLILLMAILENSNPGYLSFEVRGYPKMLPLLLRLAFRGGFAVFSLILSFLIFTPIKIFTRRASQAPEISIKKTPVDKQVFK